jgi:hypothetical protein
MKLEAKAFGRVLKKCSPYFNVLPKLGRYVDAASGAVTKRDGCVLSTGYDKDATVQQALRVLEMPTKVVVHVDDGEINLVTLARNDPLASAHLLVLAHFPLVPGSAIGGSPEGASLADRARDRRDGGRVARRERARADAARRDCPRSRVSG